MPKKKLLPVKTPTRIGFCSFLADQGGCGVLRTITPYLLLNQLKIPKVSIYSSYFMQYMNDLNFYKNYSFIQFQRSATENHLRIHEAFRKSIQSVHKVPIVYEIDDLITEIPEWNFAYHYYNDNIPYIETMMRKSNAIVTSTYPLKMKLSKYNKNIEVVPNHLPKFIWGDVTPKKSLRVKPRILWAGSQNHFKHKMMQSAPDGGDFGNGLMAFIRNTVKEYTWVFMGALPLELEDIRSDIEFHNWVNTWQYPQYIKRLSVDMGIAPLQKNSFNESKSNIKALEFTALGVPGVYSNVSPYNNMTIKCDTEDFMIDQIRKLASDPDKRLDVWEKDHNTLKDQLWWEEGNNLIKYVNTYLSLMGRKLP
jgi:O-antigen biosynthesis protein